jgi:hypothetical protein
LGLGAAVSAPPCDQNEEAEAEAGCSCVAVLASQ